MKTIRLWLQTYRALKTWIFMCRVVRREINKKLPATPEELAMLRRLESNIGNNVLTLIGVYPLNDSWEQFK